MAKRDKEPREALSFEQCLTDLEKIQEKLGSGDLPLDKAIAEYERGVVLLRECYGILQKAEKKILVLTDDGKGGMKAVPLRGAGDDEEEGEDEEDADDGEDDDGGLF